MNRKIYKKEKKKGKTKGSIYGGLILWTKM